MPNGAWTRLPIYLIWGGLLVSGLCPISNAQECGIAKSINIENINTYNHEPVLESEMLSLTNQYRTQRGLLELAPDDSLAQIARQHSLEMAQQGFISHSQPSGDLRLRMAQAGYRYEIARENVATAPSIALAEEALTESPGHEGNILASDVIRIGIGVARCPNPFSNQLFITQIFAAPRREYAPEIVQTTIIDRIDELRQSGAGSMELSEKLEEIANRSLNSIEIPYKREQLKNLLAESSNDLSVSERSEFSRLQANVQMVYSPKHLNIPNSAPDGHARSYGSAIRQITDSENQTAFLVLTLIGVAR
jgi:hypothetical protein